MVEQLSEEWFRSRLGKVTASRVADVMSKVKSGESAGVKNYRAQLIAERLSGCREESYVNTAMQRGIDMEEAARNCYEYEKNVVVEKAESVDHPTIPWFSASPDGYVGEDGLVEIKVPNTASHLEYLLGNKPPTQYVPQMTAQLACTGRKFVDFVSYDDRLPEEYQLFVVRFHRDEQAIKEMETAVVAFNASVEKMIADLKVLRP